MGKNTSGTRAQPALLRLRLLSVNKNSRTQQMEIAKMGRDIQKERLLKVLLPFVEIARSQGCHSLREMRPIVEAERMKVFPKLGKLTQTGLYHGLRALREKGMDPGPDDVSRAMRRVARRKKVARSKGA